MLLRIEKKDEAGGGERTDETENPVCRSDSVGHQFVHLPLVIAYSLFAFSTSFFSTHFSLLPFIPRFPIALVNSPIWT